MSWLRFAKGPAVFGLTVLWLVLMAFDGAETRLLASEPEVGPRAQSAIPAHDFLQSIGACSAVSRRGENLGDTVRSAEYLGLRWMRVVYRECELRDLIALHRKTGIRFSFGLGSGSSDIEAFLSLARRLADAGALLAIEGNNEPNNWPVSYQGQAGGGMQTWLPVAKIQRDLYLAVKDTPQLAAYPVWNLSSAGAQVDNAGLQFLTIPKGADALMPEGTQYADYANCHNYITHPDWPGIHDNQTWIAANPTSASPMDGLYRNYGETWMRRYRGYSEPELLALPRVTTETGCVAGKDGVTEELQGKLYICMYLAQFKQGWKHTSIYLLRDRTDENGNQAYGFFRPDYSPRPAAVYLHNLTTILADPGPVSAPGKLKYSIPNQPATVHDLLLQKRDGAFMLIVWGERFTGGADDLAIEFGKTHETVNLYDPKIDPSPIETKKFVRSIELSLTDHPIVIEFR